MSNRAGLRSPAYKVMTFILGWLILSVFGAPRGPSGPTD
jgi:hypothetical protein